MLQSVLQSRTFGSAAQHAGDSAASEPHVYEVHRHSFSADTGRAVASARSRCYAASAGVAAT